jgi:RHS repeat-associated protein
MSRTQGSHGTPHRPTDPTGGCRATRRGLRPLLAALVLGAAALAARPAHAQFYEPPQITITPNGGSVGTAASVSVTVTLRTGSIYNNTLRVWVNDQETTALQPAGSSPMPGATYNNNYSGTLTLAVGENRVLVEGCYHQECTRQTVVFTRYSTSRMQPGITLAFRPDRRIPNPSEGAASYATVPYVSRDVSRSVSLVYLSGQAQPQGLVEVDAADYSADPPTTMSIQIINPWGYALMPEVFYRTGSGATRLAVRWDGSTYNTSALVHTIVVRSYWADGTFTESTTPARVVIVNERQSPFGAGWSMSGLQRLHLQDANTLVLTEGDGAAGVFTRTGSCTIHSNTTTTLTRCGYTSPAGDFSSFFRDSVHNGGGSYYERVRPDGSFAIFFADGRLSYTQDRFGNRTTFGWGTVNGTLVVTGITDPAGKTLSLGYFAAGATTAGSQPGKLASIQDPGGRVTYFGYLNAAGNLTHITDPDQAPPRVFSYGTGQSGTQHLLTAWTDRAGGTFNLEYDHAGLVARTLAPTVTVGLAGTSQRPTTVTRSAASRVLPTFMTTLAAPGARVTPDQAWNVTVTPRGDSTMVVLDRWGAPARSRDVQGRTATAQRDASGRDSITISAFGDTTLFRWEGPNLKRQTSGAAVREMWYGTYGLLTRETSGRHTTRYWYDARGTLDSLKVAKGVGRDLTLRFTNDAYGRRLSQTDSVGRVTTYQYQPDGFQNTASVTYPGNVVDRYAYDGYGRRTTVTNALWETTSTQYDLLNRTTLLTDALGNATQQQQGRAFLDQVIDPESQRHTFQRNVLGWDTVRVDPRGQVTRLRYRVDGQTVSTINRRGQVVELDYDAQGRLVQQRADGTVTTLEYDPAGRFMVVVNGESRDTTHLDTRGRPVRHVSIRNGQRYAVESGWNTNEGARSLVSYVAGGMEIETSRFGFATERVLAGTEAGDTLFTGEAATRFESRGDGTLAWMRLPTGLRMDFTYSPNGPWVTGVTFSDAAVNSALGLTYGRDALGRVSSRGDAGGSWVYGYDAAGRLDRYGPVTMTQQYVCTGGDDDGGGGIGSPVTGLPVCHWTFVPDSSGIVTFSYDSAGNPAGYDAAVDAGNRLARLGEYTMQYDADGNLTHRYRNGALEQTLSWNSLGQLTSVWTSGTGTTTFGYDGIGRRVRKTAPNGTVTRYVYDGDQIAMELDGAGNVVATYTYFQGIDQPQSVKRGGQRYYYVRDHLGSITGLVNGGGALANQYRYDAWGNAQQAQEAVPNPFRFTGREYDAETGLYFHRARYYDPRIRRFVSEDPAGLEGGVNLYAYVGNDPVNFRDPTGRYECPASFDGFGLSPEEFQVLQQETGGRWADQMRAMGCDYKIDGTIPIRGQPFLNSILSRTRYEWDKFIKDANLQPGEDPYAIRWTRSRFLRYRGCTNEVWAREMGGYILGEIPESAITGGIGTAVDRGTDLAIKRMAPGGLGREAAKVVGLVKTGAAWTSFLGTAGLYTYWQLRSMHTARQECTERVGRP